MAADAHPPPGQPEQNWWLNMVPQARTLWERLPGGDPVEGEARNEDLARAWLAEWCQVVARGNGEEFRRRLALDGLAIEDVALVLGRRQAWEDPSPPNWLGLLREVVREPARPGAASGEALPFEDVLLPFVGVARRRLETLAGPACAQLAPAAMAALERYLLAQLCELAAHALFQQFQMFLLRHPSPPDPGKDAMYRRFVTGMQGGGLLRFLTEYPVLARLLGQGLWLWLAAAGEFLGRLAADRQAIGDVFAEGGDPGLVVDLQLGLSDAHRGGRTVVALTFASGLRLVYKPKDLGMDQAYYGLLAWLNGREPLLPFQVLQVLNRATHGWVEHVGRAPCSTAEAGRRFYQRGGMLLALVYALEGVDCHFQNLIAHGEHPLLVDLETLMTPVPYPDYSVLHTRLLPTWVPGWDQDRVDVSGLSGRPGQAGMPPQPRWRDVNRDAMRLVYEAGAETGDLHVPLLGGVALPLRDHGDDVVAGFSAMYRMLIAQREALLAADSPLQDMAGRPVRFVFRATQEYVNLLQSLLVPRYLQDGVARSIGLEQLAPRVLEAGAESEAARRQWWPLLAAETRAMERQDVPYFSALTSDTRLILESGAEIPGFFPLPAFQRVRDRLRAMGDADLARQVGMIREALGTTG